MTNSSTLFPSRHGGGDEEAAADDDDNGHSGLRTLDCQTRGGGGQDTETFCLMASPTAPNTATTLLLLLFLGHGHRR